MRELNELSPVNHLAWGMARSVGLIKVSHRDCYGSSSFLVQTLLNQDLHLFMIQQIFIEQLFTQGAVPSAGGTGVKEIQTCSCGTCHQ